jgi:hypothetical protein
MWRGKAGDEVARAVWKAKRTPDEPLACLGVWRGKASDEGCVESRKNTRRAFWLVWVCGDVRRAMTVVEM